MRIGFQNKNGDDANRGHKNVEGKPQARGCRGSGPTLAYMREGSELASEGFSNRKAFTVEGLVIL